MTLKECLDQVGSYEEVMGRLRSEKLVQKFLLRYLDDPSFDNLKKAMQEKDYHEAFRAAHTIKGVCATLGLGRLEKSGHDLTEALRPEVGSPEADALFVQVEKDYQATVDAIKAFKESNGL